ncbi:MAG TPA: glycosyltransferase family 87 protein [Gemmataceae bacterium]|jgi:hypothetical protein|nr:glycosyltransferase family 87 protein [Gemmataceae bacterium]
MPVLAWSNRAWNTIEPLLRRDRIRFFCWGLLAVSLLLLVMSFVTSDENHQNRFGSLGADFAGFYYAGKILNGPTPEKLYDATTQDESYYEIFPAVRGKENLPYVHPPFVAAMFRPLASLPYPTAYAVWLVLSAGLYGAGLAVTWRVLPSMPGTDRILAILLALTFEPFLMESWLGGQLSGLAFLCLALAFLWEQEGKPLLSGLALGLILYKPTLVILLLPMLVVTIRWRTLLGVCFTALFLSLISLIAVGKNICLSYVDALQGFTGTTTGTGMVRKDWKFIDLNFFFRNLFGEPTLLGRILVLAIVAAMLIFLFISWWNMDRGGERKRWLVWAGTVTSTMVVNVYMGIYDLILIIPAVLWTAEVFYRHPNRMASYFPTFKLLAFLVIVLSWITQPLARVTGVQIITLVLLALAAFQLRLAWIMSENTVATIPNSAGLSKTAICQ